MRLAQNGDLEAAERSFSSVIKAAPQLVEGYTSLAVVYEMGRQFKKAFDTYRAGMKVHPDSAMLPRNMCTTMLRLVQESTLSATGQTHDDVRSICLRAKELMPDNPEILSILGDMYTLFVEWESAATSYQSALRVASSKPSSGRGRSRSRGGDDDDNDSGVTGSSSSSSSGSSGSGSSGSGSSGGDGGAQSQFDMVKTLSNMANCFSRSGNVLKAIESITRSIKLRPDDAHNLALYSTIRCTGFKFDFVARLNQIHADQYLARSLSLRDDSCKTGL